MATITASSQPLSSMLLLPAELRNTIYQYVLCQPFLSRAETAQADHANSKPLRRHFCTNLLLVCRQINLEATPILYGQNIFVAHESLLATMPSMLLTVHPTRTTTRPILQRSVVGQIKRFRVRVRLDVDPRYTAQQVAESFSGVEELEIEVFQAMFDSCSFAKLTLFEGVRDVGKAIVSGSIGDGRYAAWLAKAMMMPPGTRVAYDEQIVEEFSKSKPYSWSQVGHVLPPS